MATKADTFAQKGVAFGIPYALVDGNDVLAVYKAVKQAIDHARKGNGPSLIEAYTYRMGPHTTSDDPSIYRTKEEEDAWAKKDPLIRFKAYMISKGYWSEAEESAYLEELDTYIGDVFRKVESYGAEVALEEIFEHTYKELTDELKEQIKEHKQFMEEL